MSDISSTSDLKHSLPLLDGVSSETLGVQDLLSGDMKANGSLLPSRSLRALLSARTSLNQAIAVISGWTRGEDSVSDISSATDLKHYLPLLDSVSSDIFQVKDLAGIMNADGSLLSSPFTSRVGINANLFKIEPLLLLRFGPGVKVR